MGSAWQGNGAQSRGRERVPAGESKPGQGRERGADSIGERIQRAGGAAGHERLVPLVREAPQHGHEQRERGRATPRQALLQASNLRNCIKGALRAASKAQMSASILAEVSDAADLVLHGQHDAWKLGYFEFLSEVLGLPLRNKTFEGLRELARHGGWALPYREVCFVSERPSLAKYDERHLPHVIDGPVVVYPDGWKVYALNGEFVPPKLVDAPETITPIDIECVQGTKTRRRLLEGYGHVRWIKSTSSQVISEDDAGILYRRDVPRDEPLVMVKVKNSTPEPDGSFKSYFLRVPPTVQTAREAVAWTFGLSGHDYRPAAET